MSYLSAIGFGTTPEALEQRMAQAAREAKRYDTPEGTYLQWAPGAGAELWIQVSSQGEIVGCNPHFAGLGRMQAAIIETVNRSGRPLEGRCAGWAAPSDPKNPYSGIHPLVVALPDFACVGDRILATPVVTLQIAAFATELQSFPTETAFLDYLGGYADEANPGARIWDQTEREDRAPTEAFLSGTVIQSERRDNPVTRQEFWWLVLRTDAGTIDVVTDLQTAPRRPVAGTLVAGTFGLSARVVSELPPVPAPGL